MTPGLNPATRPLGSGELQLHLVRRVVGLVEHRVRVQGSVARIALPRSQDALLDLYIEEAEAFEHRTPYYGIIWPSALGLARTVGGFVRDDDRCVELGSGLGLGGIAAALTAAPSSVLLTDHDPAAARLGRLNARLSGVASRVRSKPLDWMSVEEWPRSHFDCAFAADIIYEEEAVAPVAKLLAHTLRPGGRFLLADGERRIHRAKFSAALRADGAFKSHGTEELVAVCDDAVADHGSSNVVLSVWERTDIN